MKHLVLYHNNCTDGVTAAWAIYQKHPDAYFVGVTHRPLLDLDNEEMLEHIFDIESTNHRLNKEVMIKDFDWEAKLKDLHVHIVDFCLRPHQLEFLAGKVEYLNVLDHHKTARESVEEYINNPGYEGNLKEIYLNKTGTNVVYGDENTRIEFNDLMSGATMTFRHFVGDEPSYPLRMVQDRDLWTWDLEDTRDFSTGLREGGYMDNSSSTLDKLSEIFKSDNKWKEVVKLGNLFETRKDKNISKVMSTDVVSAEAHNKATKEVFKIALVNTNEPSIISDMGNRLTDGGKFDMAFMYGVKGNGDVAWSIRSKKSVDCSIFAKYFRGGGHPQAAGFSTDLETLHQVLIHRLIEIN